jgi:hypothetical protein
MDKPMDSPNGLHSFRSKFGVCVVNEPGITNSDGGILRLPESTYDDDTSQTSWTSANRVNGALTLLTKRIYDNICCYAAP